LTSVTITGKVQSIDIDGASNLETINLDKVMANTVIINNNEDLSTITTGAAKIKSLTITNNSGLTSAALDYDTYTLVKTTAATGDGYGILDVNNNANLASLTVHTKSLNSLQIHTNAKLAKVSFPYLAAAGIGTAPTLVIKGNAFVASEITDTYEETSAGSEIKTGTTDTTANKGTITSDSGLKTLQTWIDAAIAANTTKTLEVWIDEVTTVKTVAKDGTVSTENGVKLTKAEQIASAAGKVNAVVYIVPKEDKVSNFVGAISGEARSYVFLLNRDNNGVVKPLGAGEGFVVKYGSDSGDTVTFAQSSDDSRTSVTDLIKYMNDDTLLDAAGIQIEAEQDSQERYIYSISYTQTSNSINKAGTVSKSGNLYAKFGTGWDGKDIFLTAALSASANASEIASDFATLINGEDEFNATVITTGPKAHESFYVTRNVSGTASEDKSPLMAATPALTLYPLSTTSTAQFGNNVVGFRTASYTSNTFASNAGTFSLSASAGVKQSNLRVTLRDTSGFGFNSSVTMTASAATKSNVAITVGTTTNVGSIATGPYLLENGVSIVSASENTSTSATDVTATTYYVADGVAVGTENVTNEAVTAITTDRTGWL